MSHKTRRGSEVAAKKSVKRHRRDTRDNEEQSWLAIIQFGTELNYSILVPMPPEPPEPPRHVAKKQQRIEKEPSSSSEQASIPEPPPVAMENSEQSSEETFQEVPVVAKRRGGKKGMRALDLFEEEALRQREEEVQLTNQRADPVAARKFLAPTSAPTGSCLTNQLLLSLTS